MVSTGNSFPREVVKTSAVNFPVQIQTERGYDKNNQSKDS